MKKFILLGLFAISILAATPLSMAEDIELYISSVVREAGKSTKVLIIFDNSGSMSTIDEVNAPYLAKGEEVPKDYDAEDVSHAYNDEAIYFNVGGTDSASIIPDSPSDARRFSVAINSCETSKALLAKYGRYTGRLREYTYQGQTGSWEELPSNNGLNIDIIDCEDDAYIEDSAGNVVNEGTTVNAAGVTAGYPVDEQGSKNSPVYHSGTKVSTNVDWSSGSYVTLYTANYLRWYHTTTKEKIDQSRMESAQNSMTSVINTTPSVDFGLEIFNYNQGDAIADANGGRIAIGIRKMTAANKATLLDVINEQLTSETWTPLCESLYEANQYFSGGIVDFGDDDINVGSGPGSYVKNTPARDTVIEEDGSYKSPFGDCANSVSHVILITDGEPTNDHGADSKILALKSKVQKTEYDAEADDDFPVFDDDGNPVMIEVAFTDELPSFNNDPYTADGSNSYLPALAGWMSNFDVNPTLDGIQTVQTHTIAFSSGADNAKDLLEETARRGQGNFLIADDDLALTGALTNILASLKPGNDSLTSASVAANNFDRTQTLDSVYYAMFDPQNSPRWQGNLKKYKAVNDELTGVGGVKAICENEDGVRTFCPTVKSFWSPSIDGDTVGKGGVVAWFNKTPVSERKVYLDNGNNNSLIDFDRTNLESAFTDQAGLAAKLGVAGAKDEDGNDIESAEINKMINWAIGMDVDDDNNDESYTDMRKDVFGDPLHSKPLVVNYGDSIRIVVGTNAGALHMFQDNGATVEENWAFMPKEFVGNIKTLRNNYSSVDKVYGIDGEITVLLDDKNGDGVINGTDTAWIVFGLRRGGSSYYALDISDPDVAPTLMWKIDNTIDDFKLLGQSWSKPKVGYSKLNTSGDVANPVIFIGGGYDTNKDASGPGTADDKGKAVYMLDAKTGALKWSMTPSGGGGDTIFSGTDSIPAGIGLLDSTGNGLTDRLYVGDTGGNVWRVDMPTDNKSDFSVFKLASLGGSTNETDRRFFYEPSIVRTFISETVQTTVTKEDGTTKEISVHQEIPYDAILISSGDRSNPLGKDTTDRAFMIKDEYIKTQTFSASSSPSTPSTIVQNDTQKDLYNYTNDPFENMSSMTSQALDLLQRNVSAKSGWYINLQNSGEKGSAEALVINGVAYFTTYSPPAFAAELEGCKPPSGIGSLLAVDLALGVKKHKIVENVRSDDQRYININSELLGTPTLIVLPDDPTDSKSDASGDIIVGDTIIPVGFTLKTMRTYLYITEEQ
jgi:type IV pilus assembly protein PilY1